MGGEHWPEPGQLVRICVELEWTKIKGKNDDEKKEYFDKFKEALNHAVSPFEATVTSKERIIMPKRARKKRG